MILNLLLINHEFLYLLISCFFYISMRKKCIESLVYHAGLTASTISFPLEVARKRMMVGALQGQRPAHMVAALSEVVSEQGLLGLYRGWGASSLKVMPSSGITWMFYELWKDILLVGKPHI